MLSYEDFKNVDGKVDWQALRKAQVDCGESCYYCGGFILRVSGCQTLCYDCKGLNERKEVSHDDFIRCPHCSEIFTPHGNDYYELYEDGDHTIFCDNCEKEYDIVTHVSYSFVSPPLVKENENVKKV